MNRCSVAQTIALDLPRGGIVPLMHATTSVDTIILGVSEGACREAAVSSSTLQWLVKPISGRRAPLCKPLEKSTAEGDTGRSEASHSSRAHIAIISSDRTQTEDHF